jgi:hypothetical protein
MPNVLTNNDYVQILKYYKLRIPASKKLLKKQAEKIMAEKLCKCIKKLDPQNEARSIGICTNTIFNRKGLSRSKFQCTKKQSVNFGLKTNKNKTIKKRNS